MPEENTTDNLRRFLESDDPAKVLMGLSMAKGAGADQTLLPPLFALGLWAEQKEIRSKAAQMFKETAPVENQKLFDRLSQPHDESLYELAQLDDQPVLFAVKALNFALGSASHSVAQGAIKTFVPELVEWDGIHWQHHSPPNLSRAIAITSALGNELAIGLLENIRKIAAPFFVDIEIENEDFVPILILFAEHGCLAVLQEMLPFICEEATYQPHNWFRARSALVSLGPPAVEPLLAFIADGFSHDDADNCLEEEGAIQVLGDIGDPRAVELLLKLLGRIDRADNWDTAVEALGHIGDPRAVEPLIAVLADPHHPWPDDFDYENETRQAAAEALGWLGDARALAPLIAALEHDELRSSAVKALGLLGDARAVEPLTEVLETGAPHEARQAAIALCRLGDARAIEQVIEELQPHREREAAAMALGELGDPRAIQPLVGAMQGLKSYEPKDVFIEALKKLGHEVDRPDA
jgi:HEAT repeat protein